MTYKIFKGNNVLAGYEDTIEKAQERCDRNNGWSYMKVGQFTREELAQHITWKCINKQLNPHGYTYTDVKKGARYEFFKIDRLIEKRYLFGLIKFRKTITTKHHWVNLFKFDSEEQYDEWAKYCIDLFLPYCDFNEERAQFEFAWFDTMYGLQIKSEENDI